jgi:hypothetical protein
VNAGKTADEESGSRTEAITAVKLEVENVLEGEGGPRALFLGSCVFFLLPFLLSLLTIAKSAHQQHILISLLLRWIIYLTT